METTQSETHLDMARRHYRDAVYRVVRQARVLERLKAHGHDTEQAQRLLLHLKVVMKQARVEWEREEKEAADDQKRAPG